jgi:thiamine biosynthesis protein ThiI
LRPAGELSTKAPRTRRRFFETLRRNLSIALERRGINHTVASDFGRLWVHTDAVEDALAPLSRVFGVASLSPVELTVEPTLESIVRSGREAFAERVQGRKYAVRAKRHGSHSFSSLELERELGTALNPGATVDLDHPDVTVFVEALGDRAYLYTRRIPGAGGLPVGVQGRVLVLLSGGFDSAVAAFRILRRGAPVDYLLCNLAGRAYEQSVRRVARVLTEAWSAGERSTLYVVEFSAVADELKRTARSQYWQVVLKRMMYRAGARVAADIGAQALVTGEALGQVSSQTLENLAAIGACVDIPVLRPLIGFDKTEIIAEARRVGTAALSERVKEYCALASGRPVTATTRSKVDHQEADVDLEILWRAVDERRIIDLGAPPDAQSRADYVLTSNIPKDAVVLDCQPEHLYRAWHLPGAKHCDPSELIDNPRRLDRDRTYVLYCAEGTQAAYLAELLQRAGLDAYAFDGGASALERQVRQRPEPTAP